MLTRSSQLKSERFPRARFCLMLSMDDIVFWDKVVCRQPLAPISDVSVGVKEALDQLHDITGRMFLIQAGSFKSLQPDGTELMQCSYSIGGSSTKSGSYWLTGGYLHRER
jgi:hypothetical protein